MILKLGYLGLTLLMIIIIIAIGQQTIGKTFQDKEIAKKKGRTLILSLLAWHLYIYLLGLTGILQSFDFPPRFFLLLILPAFIFTGIFIFRNRNNDWIRNIPEHWLIYYQSFRILIESLFVFSVTKGILHANVTIEGYNYDMVYAFTAPVIAYLVFQRKALSKKVAIAWNYLGLVVIAFIIFLFLSTIYLPQLYGSETELMPIAFTTYPYITVAAFLMPSAVFMHVLSIVQLSRK